MEEALIVKYLNKNYPSFSLKDVTFSLKKGTITGFVGRNGAGKTTTLKCIYNLVKRDSGSILYEDKDVLNIEKEFKENVGLVFGESTYYQTKKLKQITSITSSFYPNWNQKVYEEYLKVFNLDENKTIKELSSGMKVKFSLALALSHGAKLLLLDEPTSGLDPVSRDELLDIFEDIVSDGEHTILFSTHVISDLEKCADEIIYIKNGEIVESGNLREFENRYKYYTFSEPVKLSNQSNLVFYKERANKIEGVGYSDKDLGDESIIESRTATLEEIVVAIERGAENV